MSARPTDLQLFLDATREAVMRRVAPDAPAGIAAAKIFAALARPAPVGAIAAPARLPVARHWVGAVDRARGEVSELAQVAETLAAIEPRLSWERASRSGDLGPAFADGHGDAMIVGPGGLESRADLWIGASLMAPGMQYPDHHHPLDEIYLPLSRGEWRQGDGPWHEPGPGGLVYNPPDIRHAMRSTGAPLLAVWCLWARTA